MKFCYMILTLSFCMSTFAQALFTSKIQDFSGNYVNEVGSASAKFFQFDNIDFGQNPHFEIFKQAGIFFLKTPDEEIQLDDLPENITELEKLSFSNIDLNSSPSYFKISIGKLSGKSSKDSISLKGFILRCSNINTDGDLSLEIYKACFSKSMGFRLPSGNINGNKYKGLEINISNNKLKFEANISGITAKGAGKSSFDPIEKKIHFKIDKVYAGPINVTDKFWDEVKKQRSQSVKVSPPYIDIYLDVK